VRVLRSADPVLADLIARVGPFRPRPVGDGTHLDAIARAIVYQQLSGKAAATILGRFHALWGRPPTAAELRGVADEQLRAAGLSRQKIGYLRDLAERASSGDLPVDTLHDLDDAAVIERLTRVKGVGLWTAQMFLMFRLARPDVLPDGDLGIQKAIRAAYRLRKLPSPSRIQQIGARWRPYRSIACWYLWRSLDNGYWS
jgi:DNA-3-methyladenine glycosylase II